VQTHGIIGAAEAASGVPTLGLSAPSAATAASRLKAVMGQNVDPVAVAKELQVAFAEIKAEQRAANLTGASEGVNLSRIEVNVANATKGTPEYNNFADKWHNGIMDVVWNAVTGQMMGHAGRMRTLNKALNAAKKKLAECEKKNGCK
jgi:hypothetical protein